MSRISVIIILTGLLAAACGAADAGGTTVNSADMTATFESARSNVIATRQGNTRPTATRAATKTPTVPAATATATTIPATLAPGEVPGAGLIQGDEPFDLSLLVPTADMVSPEMEMVSNGPETAEDVADTYAEPEAHLERLAEWGFRQGYHRQFRLPDALLVHDTVVVVVGLVSEFETPDGARAFIEWNREYHRTCGCNDLVLEDADSIPAGDASYAMTGIPTPRPLEHWVFEWVQLGRVVVVYRIAAEDYYAWDELKELLTAILVR